MSFKKSNNHKQFKDNSYNFLKYYVKSLYHLFIGYA